MTQGQLYRLSTDYTIDKIFYKRGAIVVYIEEDSRYANQHWILLPTGLKGSIWSGHMETI